MAADVSPERRVLSPVSVVRWLALAAGLDSESGGWPASGVDWPEPAGGRPVSAEDWPVSVRDRPTSAEGWPVSARGWPLAARGARTPASRRQTPAGGLREEFPGRRTGWVRTAPLKERAPIGGGRFWRSGERAEIFEHRIQPSLNCALRSAAGTLKGRGGRQGGLAVFAGAGRRLNLSLEDER